MYIPKVVCPEGCEEVVFDVEFDHNCAGAGLMAGQFTWAIVVPTDKEVPTDDLDDIAEWDDIIEDIAILRGKGSFPELDNETIDLYNDPEYVINSRRDVPFDVTELTETNYTTLQTWSCKGARARVYVGTDDHLFGLGIVPISVNSSSDGDRDSVFTAHLTFKQEGKGIALPEVFSNPFVDME